MGNAVVHYSVVADCAPAMRSVGALTDAMSDLSGTRVQASISLAGVSSAMNDFGRLQDAQQSLASPLMMSVSAPSGISDASAALRGLRGDAQDLASAVSSMPSLDFGIAGAGAGAIRPLIDDVSSLADGLAGAASSFSGMGDHAFRASRSLGELDEEAQAAAASTSHAASAAVDYGSRLDSASGSLGGFTAAHGQATGAAQMQSSAVAMLTDDMSAFEAQFTSSASNVGRSAQQMSDDIAGARRVATFPTFQAFEDASNKDLERAFGIPGTGHGPPLPPGGRGGGGLFGGDGGEGAGSEMGSLGGAVFPALMLGAVGVVEPLAAAAGGMEAFKRVVKDTPALTAASTQAMWGFDNAVRAASQGAEKDGVPAFMKLEAALAPLGTEVGKVGAANLSSVISGAGELATHATAAITNLAGTVPGAIQGAVKLGDALIDGIGSPQVSAAINAVSERLRDPAIASGVRDVTSGLLSVSGVAGSAAADALGVLGNVSSAVGHVVSTITGGSASPDQVQSDTTAGVVGGGLMGKAFGGGPGGFLTGALLSGIANDQQAHGVDSTPGLVTGAGLALAGSKLMPKVGGPLGAIGGELLQPIAQSADKASDQDNGFFSDVAAGAGIGAGIGAFGGPIAAGAGALIGGALGGIYSVLTGPEAQGDTGPGGAPGGPSAAAPPESTANAAGTRLPTPAVDKDFFAAHPGGGTFTDKQGNTVTGTRAPDGSMQFQNKYASGDAGSYSYDAASGTSSIASHSLTDKFGSFSDATITRAGSGEQYGQAQDYNAITGQMASAGPTESKPGQANGAEFGAPSLAVAQNMLANLPGGAGGGGGSGGDGGGGDLKKYPPDVPRSVFNEEPPEIATNYDAFGVAHSHIDNDFAQANVTVDHGHVSFATPFDAQISNFSQAQLGQAVSNIGAPLGTPSNQGMSIMGHPAEQSVAGPVPAWDSAHGVPSQVGQQAQAQAAQPSQPALGPASALGSAGLLGAISQVNNTMSPANALGNVVGQTMGQPSQPAQGFLGQLGQFSPLGNVVSHAVQAQVGQPAQQGLLGQISQMNTQANPLANVTAQTAAPAHGMVGQAMGSPANAAAINAQVSAMTSYTNSVNQATHAEQSFAQQSQAVAQGIGQVGQTANTAAPAQQGQTTAMQGTANAANALGPATTTADASIGALGNSMGTATATAQGLAQGVNSAAANVGAISDVSSAISDANSAIGGLGAGAAEAGASIGSGVGQGASSSASTGAAAAGGAAAGAAGADGAAGSDGADAGSPSRKTTQIGLWLGQGLAVGQYASIPLVAAAGASMASAALAGATTATVDAQTQYNTALAGGFGAGIVAASNGVTPIAQDYGLMIGEQWAENVATGAQNVFKSSDFTALTTPQFGSKLAQAQLGLENLLPPAGQGAEYYTTTSGSAGMVQMAPVQVTNKIYLDSSLINSTVDTKISTAIGNLATAIGQQRG